MQSKASDRLAGCNGKRRNVSGVRRLSPTLDDEDAGHADPLQRRFFVVAVRSFARNQTSITLRRRKEIAAQCSIAGLRRAPERTFPAERDLKAAL